MYVVLFVIIHILESNGFLWRNRNVIHSKYRKKETLNNQGFPLNNECGRWDLNPHKRNAYKILSLARLPVPTLPHTV